MTRLFLLMLLIAGSADARTLYWRSLDVTARLDGDGELHVVERHAMVFDGDWNGGERVFRIERSQQLQLLSVTRIDAAGNERPLSRAAGSIGLHQYSWDGRRLRWRARRTSDRPFRDRALTYAIEYTMRNVVERRGDHYILSHDFAMKDRPGNIETFALQLDLDPVWDPAPGFNPSIERSDMPPGETLIQNVPLRWSGEGEPRFIRAAVPPRTVRSLASRPTSTPRPKAPGIVGDELPPAAAFLLLLALMTWSFVRRESRMGRHAPRPAPTRAWLEENVLVHRAEVVGAAWDGATGHGEVAALIAIMTAEGKIANELSPQPRLRLLVPRSTLSEYERAFVNQLFIDGDAIDRKTLRVHYAKSGFDPAAAIRRPLDAASRRLTGHSRRAMPAAFGCLALLIASMATPFLIVLSDGDVKGAIAGVILVVSVAVMLGFAIAYESKPSRGRAMLLSSPVLAGGIAVVVLPLAVAATVIALTLLVVVLWLMQRVAMWSGTAEEWRTLVALRTAREFLRGRLKRRDPKIEERWIPYILAFGLGDELDAWFVAPRRDFRDFRDRGDLDDETTMTETAGTAQTTQFVAAGGRFGGAGATGGWARSINDFAAEVPAPAPVYASGSGSSSSSSWSDSSSSSSSSGSSSSGGGSGGGW